MTDYTTSDERTHDRLDDVISLLGQILERLPVRPTGSRAPESAQTPPDTPESAEEARSQSPPVASIESKLIA